MAPSVREIQAFAIVGVIASYLSVIRRSLIREDRLRPIGKLLKTRPDLIEARLERIRPARLHLAQRRQGSGIIVGIGLNASLVGFGRPLVHSADLSIPRRQRQ